MCSIHNTGQESITNGVSLILQRKYARATEEGLHFPIMMDKLEDRKSVKAPYLITSVRDENADLTKGAAEGGSQKEHKCQVLRPEKMTRAMSEANFMND